MTKNIQNPILFLLFFLFIFNGCYLKPHYVCEIKSEANIYNNIINGNIEDPSLSSYNKNGNIFLAVSECTEAFTYSKSTTAGRFLIEVFSKSENFDYEVNDISLIIDGERHNIKEYITKYYPYESERYLPFEKSTEVSDYYKSIYHLGFVEFPTPQNNKFELLITITDSNMNQYNFTYAYTINFIFDMFISLE